jgi:Spy/CpxP family protein refolding chaperone
MKEFSMKSVRLLAGIAMLIFSIALSAQGMEDGPRGKMHGDYEKRAEHLKVILDLNESQYNQVKGILKKYQDERKAVMEPVKKSMDKIRDSEESEISTILNSTQQNKLEQLKENRPDRNNPDDDK